MASGIEDVPQRFGDELSAGGSAFRSKPEPRPFGSRRHFFLISAIAFKVV
jgi:hypothetical protein